MARKLRSQATTNVITPPAQLAKLYQEPTKDAPAVPMVPRAVIIPARVLFTIKPDDALWRDPLASMPAKQAGAIVCLYPPGNVSDERIAALKATLESNGAKVRVMPRAASEAIVAKAKGNDDGGADTRTVREIAMELVDAANTDDREELREVVTAALDAEGA